MSYSTDRNPSPPPEILKNEDLLPDRVGDSVYSKQWLYKTLMSIMKAFVGNTEKATSSAGVEGVTVKQVEECNESSIVELDPKIEEDACTLWDMSANYEVSNFLLECGVIDIFLEVIEKTKSPRLLEIAIGILANMACFDPICQNISKNKTLLYSVILLSGTSDSPTLLQLFRLVNCGIANTCSQNYWLEVFDENPFFMENMKFIFENNLNGSVLNAAFELLDRILNEYLHYCHMWGHQPYVVAVIAAGGQLQKHAYPNLDQFFYALNTIFHHPPNIITYAEYFGELQPLFHGYFEKLAGEEALPQPSRITAVICTFATYGNLLKSKNINRELISVGTSVLDAIRIIYIAVNQMTMNHEKFQASARASTTSEKSNCEQPAEKDGSVTRTISEDEYNNWVILRDSIVFAVYSLFPYVKEEIDKQILNEVLEIAFA